VVAHALEAAENEHGYGVSQVHFGACWVDAELGHKPAALLASRGDPLRQFAGGGLQLLRPGSDQGRLLGRRQVRQVQATALRGLGQQFPHDGVGRKIRALEQRDGAVSGLAQSGHPSSPDFGCT
jgi:hypothetical protein